MLPKLNESSSCLDPFNDIGVRYEGPEFRPFAYKAFCKFKCVNDCKLLPTKIVLSNFSCAPDSEASYPHKIKLTCKCEGKRANGKKTEICNTGVYTWLDVERLFKQHCKRDSSGNCFEGTSKNCWTIKTPPSRDGEDAFQALIELMRRSATYRTTTVTTSATTSTTQTTIISKVTRTTMGTNSTTTKTTIGVSTKELPTMPPMPPVETAVWGKEAMAWNPNSARSADYYYVYMDGDSVSKKNPTTKTTMNIMISNHGNDSLMRNTASVQYRTTSGSNPAASSQHHTTSLPHRAPSLPDPLPWSFNRKGVWKMKKRFWRRG
uniref:Uncharacterized protein n=1 Tax=Romanomermis culicivorax TaxID=13658 RepID=A0A915L0N0_ROMCU